jgi:hypothetical protein
MVKKLLAWISIAALCPAATAPAAPPARFIAYSLREAQARARAGGPQDPELRDLASINRIVGMVIDRESKDAILVGCRVEGQAGATLDDLVVALRARLGEGEWPSVSIDPVESTKKSGLQEVHFVGGIEDTQFGADFLECDVILKRYSLGMLDRVGAVKSYRDLMEEEARAEAEREGARVLNGRWESDPEMASALVESVQNQEVARQKMIMSRFWFYPDLKRHGVVHREDAFAITMLLLDVKTELLSARCSKGIPTPERDEVGDAFARLFRERFWEVSAKHPILGRLKVLYDVLAVAQALKERTKKERGDRPDLGLFLDYFLKEYRPRTVATRKDFPILSTKGLFNRSDEKDLAICLSGGIQLSTIVEELNEGDLASLRDPVILSRPGPRTLSWSIPIEGWRFPNDVALGGDAFRWPPIPARTIGCSVFTQSYLIQRQTRLNLPGAPPIPKVPAPAAGPGPTVFRGFRPTPPSPRAFSGVPSPGGVSMEMKLDDEDFEADRSGSLEKQRKDALKGRPAGKLSWPAKDGEKKR